MLRDFASSIESSATETAAMARASQSLLLRIILSLAERIAGGRRQDATSLTWFERYQSFALGCVERRRRTPGVRLRLSSNRGGAFMAAFSREVAPASRCRVKA